MKTDLFQPGINLCWWRSSNQTRANSNQFLDHLKEIALANPEVINPLAKNFKGEVLANVIYG